MAEWPFGLAKKVKQIFCSMMGTEEEPSVTENPKTVVVVGGGVSGSLVAYYLQPFANVVLIDRKEYFEIPWAIARSKVDPIFAERSIINHRDYLPNVQIVISEAADVTDRQVITTEGEHFAYDFLVLATGYTEYIPRTRAEKLNYYERENDKIKSSDSILIVGGGPSGVELASEIVVKYPEKKVTLVHRGPRLIQFVGPKASQKALDWLTARKVEVILNQSVDVNSGSDGFYRTSDGEGIKADCCIFSVGRPLSTSWLKGTILKDSLTTHERLMVDQNLRVWGMKNIFAIGDITNSRELKQGYLAEKHADVASKNIKLLLRGGKETKMATYKPGWPIAIISLGSKDAIVQVGSFTLGGRIPGMLKSGDLFVGKTRKKRGLKSKLELQ